MNAAKPAAIPDGRASQNDSLNAFCLFLYQTPAYSPLGILHSAIELFLAASKSKPGDTE
jgi:hypothetical protein